MAMSSLFPTPHQPPKPPDPEPEAQADASASPAGMPRRFMWNGAFATPLVHARLVSTDDGRRLSVERRGFPLWFAGACSAIPLIAAVAVFLFQGIVRGSYPMDLVPVLVLGPIAALVLLARIRWLNRRTEGVVAVLDRTARTLELPEYGATHPGASIRELIIVHGMQKATRRTGARRGTHFVMTAELSVVVEGRVDGTPHPRSRWHVMTGPRRRLEAFADAVSREFKAPTSSHRA